MAPYLTPQRFRTMGFGIDISELDDEELLSLIHAASTAVDAYCNVPRLPQVHSFLGGTIKDEKHTWRLPAYSTDIGQRRVYPFHWPVKEVTDFKIKVTNTQYIGIAPSELFVNETEKYFEVVSLALTSAGLFQALIIPNVGLATPVCLTSYKYGWDLAVEDEYLIPSDGQTFRAQNQFWYIDPDDPPVIKIGGVVQQSGYTVDYYEGTVTFDENQAANETVTASYRHKLPSDIQWGCGHIVAHLHGQAELHARGMAHLNRIRVAEVQMDRRNLPATDSLIADLDQQIPEAALYLSAYRADHMTVR